MRPFGDVPNGDGVVAPFQDLFNQSLLQLGENALGSFVWFCNC